MRRICLPSVLLLLLLCPTSRAWSQSIPPEDLEASGDDLEMDGSGSGDGFEPEITTVQVNNLGQSNKASVTTTNRKQEGTHVSQTPEDQPWKRKAFFAKESKSVMESQDILAVVIGGGLAGLALAVLLGGILIYKWQKKDEAGYVQGQQQREQDYLKDNNKMHQREETSILV